MARGVNLQQGESITLAASAARTVGANGTAIYIGGERISLAFLLDITASATAAGDTLDVYVDVSFDNVTWINAIHFTQQAGNGTAKKEYAMLTAGSALATVTVVTPDAASGVIRPDIFGAYYRARWALVDGGGGDTSHTFSVTGYAL